MTTTTPTRIHPFEAAGLGLAPFRYVGSEVRLHQVPGCHPKAGASCDFCGTSIALCCLIESADGKRFKVGCDCVAKTARKSDIHDNKLASDAAKAKRDHNRKKRWQRELAKAKKNAAVAPVRYAVALSVCTELEKLDDGFSAGFAKSLRCDILNGRIPSFGQLGLLDKLADERDVVSPIIAAAARLTLPAIRHASELVTAAKAVAS